MQELQTIYNYIQEDPNVSNALEIILRVKEFEPYVDILYQIQQQLDIILHNSQVTDLKNAFSRFVKLERFVLLKHSVFQHLCNNLAHYVQTEHLLDQFDQKEIGDVVKLVEECEIHIQSSISIAMTSIKIKAKVGEIQKKNKLILIHYVIMKHLIEHQSLAAIEFAHSTGILSNPYISQNLAYKLLGYPVVSYDQSLLDVLASLYVGKGEQDAAIDILEYLVQYTDWRNAIENLRRITIKIRIRIEAEDLARICESLIQGSSQPLITCVEISGLFKKLSETFLTNKEEYFDQHVTFSEAAFQMINSFPSDSIASMFLLEPDNEGTSALSIAVRSGDVHFLSNPRVSRIINRMWKKPKFLNTEDEAVGSRDVAEMFHVILKSPTMFFLLPGGKFLIRGLCYLGFVIAFCGVFTFYEININNGFERNEFYMYMLAIAFLISEVAEVLSKGIQDYFSNYWNILDAIIYGTTTEMMILRFVNANEERNLRALMVFKVLKSITIVLLWIRIIYIFTIHPTLGPLQRSVFKMTRDIRNFLIFGALFCFGSSLTLHLMYSDQENASDYAKISATISTTFLGMMGDFDSDIVYDYDVDIVRGAFQIIYSFYLLGGSVILLNLLIAMMSDTYSSVQDESLKEYFYGKAAMVYEYDQESHTLPPPFSPLVYIISIPIYLVFRCLKMKFPSISLGHKIDYETTKVDTRVRASIASTYESGTTEDYWYLRTSFQDIKTKLPKRRLDHICKYESSFEPWICHYCYRFNVCYTLPILCDYMYQLDQTEDKLSLRVLSSATGICGFCKRYKVPMDYYEQILYNTSLILFKVFLYIPLLILLFVLGIPGLTAEIREFLNKYVKKHYKIEKEYTRQYENSRRHHYRLNQDKVQWITSNLPQEDDVKHMTARLQRLNEKMEDSISAEGDPSIHEAGHISRLSTTSISTRSARNSFISLQSMINDLHLDIQQVMDHKDSESEDFI